MPVNKLSIPITPDVNLLIYSGREDLHYEENAASQGESCWQLEEGKQYDYEFVARDESYIGAKEWFLEGDDLLVTQNPLHKNRGTITTGIYVGTASFCARREGVSQSIPVVTEIRSVKAGYQEHYRHMLADIAHYYTDLVMQQGSPVTQKFDVDYDTPQETLYQKFAFVKSIVDARQFDEAIHKIVSNPVRKWKDSVADRHVESVRRISRSGMRQLVTKSNRIPYNKEGFPLTSLPRFLTVNQKVDSINTSENQFIKYVLTTFYGFCSNLGTKKHAGERLKLEISVICNSIANHLNGSFFKEVSLPSRLNIASPVLQRKEGYREILQAWLMFDLSAKLAWAGGDNVYSAGKKNVAVLYEYWLFFKLMECVSEVFTIPMAEKSTLVSFDEDHINLNIHQGRMKMIHGQTTRYNRLLNVNLYYNRTFAHQENLDSAGSWTMNMRPDYTLSIWPGEMTDIDAERLDAIVYIHFDAKYRLDKILFEEKQLDEDALELSFQKEKEDREKDIYKRGDLLKMHAYKDAIRRTAGAYILYPGEKLAERKVLKGYHEIIPGLGAFPIAPGHEDEQLPELKKFLLDVVKHFANRTSQREKIALADHTIHNETVTSFFEPFPEPYEYGAFPDSVKVLIDYYKDETHLNWILKYRRYYIRFDATKGREIKINEQYLEARYLLLYERRDLTKTHLFKILLSDNPVIVTDKELARIGYPDSIPGQLYLKFGISEKNVEPELQDRDWYIGAFVKEGDNVPIIVTYTNLFSPSIIH